MTLYRQLTEQEEAEARQAERLVRVVNGLEILLSAEEEQELRAEWADGRFRQAKKETVESVDSEFSSRINAGFSYSNHVFDCDGMAVDDIKAVAAKLVSSGAQGNQTWPDKDGVTVTMTNENFIAFSSAVSAWNSGHRAIRRGKKASIGACANNAALEAYLAATPVNSGWPMP